MRWAATPSCSMRTKSATYPCRARCSRARESNQGGVVSSQNDGHREFPLVRTATVLHRVFCCCCFKFSTLAAAPTLAMAGFAVGVCSDLLRCSSYLLSSILFIPLASVFPSIPPLSVPSSSLVVSCGQVLPGRGGRVQRSRHRDGGRGCAGARGAHHRPGEDQDLLQARQKGVWGCASRHGEAFWVGLSVGKVLKESTTDFDFDFTPDKRVGSRLVSPRACSPTLR